MPISQPTYPVTTSALVNYLGAYIDGAVAAGTAGAGNRTLTWDVDTNNYDRPGLWTDTSAPRVFIGTVDPSTIPTITMADYDTWRRV